MPSPFPGMDPYLEKPAYWRDLHQSLIYCVRAQLNAALPEGYAASAEERCYIVRPARSIYPDVSVIRTAPNPPAAHAQRTLTATIDPPLQVPIVLEEIREPFLEIRTTDAQERLITVIEVLSPANKSGEGAEEYRRKQRQVLQSDCHLLEIDLLRSGQHLVAASRGYIQEQQASWNYLVCLTRANQSEQSEHHDVWPIRVRERLPRVAVPLEEGVEDVALDLQAAFTRAYDEGPYRHRLRYDQEPEPTLPLEDALWARGLLHQSQPCA